MIVIRRVLLIVGAEVFPRHLAAAGSASGSFTKSAKDKERARSGQEFLEIPADETKVIYAKPSFEPKTKHGTLPPVFSLY